MKISWLKFLTALNCPVAVSNVESLQPCPFHPNTEPSLRVHDNSEHSLYFTCCHHNCNFKGDPVTMVAQWLNVSLPAAIELFKPGNRFYSTLLEDLSTNQQVGYTNPSINQDIIEQFVRECHRHLNAGEHEHVSLINDFLVSGKWTHSSLQYLHPDMGYMYPGSIPAQLEFIDTKAYKFEPHIVFTVRYDSQVVGFRILNIVSGVTTTHKLTTEKNYIFMPHNVGGDKLYVAPNELIAFAVYSKSRTYSNNPIPVIAMLGSSLPASFNKVSEIILLNTKKAPLTLARALELFKQDTLVDGAVTQPKISVLSPAYEVTERPLDVFLDERGNKRLLLSWIATDMVQLLKSGITAGLFDLLGSNKLPPAKLDALVASLEKHDAPADFIKDLTDYNAKASDEMFLTNGNTVRKSRAGMLGRTANHDKVVLSNVVFDIHKKYVTNYNKSVIVDCTLRVGDHAIRTTLDHEVFAHTPTLRAAVNAAFMRNGIAPKLALYGVRGFPWEEIRDLLTESSVVDKEISHLGLTDVRTVDLTNCRISGVVEPQSHIFTLSKPVQSMYAGIKPNITDPGIKPYDLLWRNQDDTSLALAGALSHIIHCISSGVDLLASGNLQPTHLLLVRSPANTLDVLFTQLVSMFSGTETVNRLPYVNPLRALKDMTELGSLPFISLMPRFQIERQMALLAESPVSLITSIPEEDCGMFMDVKNMSYLVGDSRSVYDPKSIVELQQSFPYFLQRLLRSGKQLTGQHPVPAIAVYEQIASYLGVAPAAMDKIAKPYFMSISLSMDKLFFNDVRMLVQDNDLKVVYDTVPTEEDDLTTVYVADKLVYLPRRVVGLMNQRLRKKYKAEAVDYHLADCGTLVGKDPHFWIIPAALWDRYIAKTVSVVYGSGPFKLLALSS